MNKNKFFGRRKWIFQQDGATIHTTKENMKWLSENVPEFIDKKDWPGSSPDLNVIECLEYITEPSL